MSSLDGRPSLAGACDRPWSQMDATELREPGDSYAAEPARPRHSRALARLWKGRRDPMPYQGPLERVMVFHQRGRGCMSDGPTSG
jgi:hypothetical protein